MNQFSIIEHLKQQKEIPFVEFMQLALYHPLIGYYSAGLPKFGEYGDFITAPELTPLFGQTLANQCQQILSVLSSPILFEFGAGSGRLCVDLLRRLEELDCLPVTYQILEVSGSLKKRQAELIQQEIPHLAHLVQWITQWPQQSFNGVIIANEVLDAMPVHRFLQTEQELLESYVTLNDQDELIEVFKPCTDTRLSAYVQRVLPSQVAPYLSEVNLFVESWIQQAATLLKQGALFLIDYGFPRHEYYHPDRAHGTLMCHYQHQAHTNFLIHVGQQDITAHVDFTQVAEAAFAAGLQVTGYTNQAAFLLSNGLLNLLEAIPEGKERIQANQAVKKLTHPSEMGELFKVIGLTKELDLSLTGFQLLDKRASL